jgi:hypothetical protein
VDQREKRLDGPDGGRRGPDFLSQVREVCRLRTDQDRSTSGAEIIERSRGADGAEFDHLVVRYTRGPWTKELVVGVCDGPANTEAVTRFRDAVCAHVTTEREPELVYRGEPASPDVEHAAREHHIWLRNFTEYQHLWEHHGYVAAQTQRLRADPEYRCNDMWTNGGRSWARPPPDHGRRADHGPTGHRRSAVRPGARRLRYRQDLPAARPGRTARPGGSSAETM